MRAAAAVHQMRQHEAAAASLRLTAALFLDSRTADSGRIADNELSMLAHDPVHGSQIDRALQLQIQPDRHAWNRFAAALAADADAAFG